MLQWYFYVLEEFFIFLCTLSNTNKHFLAPLLGKERHKAIERIDQLMLIGVSKLFTTTLASLPLFSIYFLYFI
jgi:hypothetical protein